jgi:hypothetical protein
MKKTLKIVFSLVSIFATSCLLTGCWLYSFSGTSIQPDVETICIEPVQNRALKVNPSLANSLYEALSDKYRKLTRLEQVEDAGDLYVLTVIEGYDVSATAITADEVAARNRLTVTVKVKFVNEKHPEENFEKNFAGYEDYDSERSLDEVEATLCDTIIEKIVEDIFNATVANW